MQEHSVLLTLHFLQRLISRRVVVLCQRNQTQRNIEVVATQRVLLRPVCERPNLSKKKVQSHRMSCGSATHAAHKHSNSDLRQRFAQFRAQKQLTHHSRRQHAVLVHIRRAKQLIVENLHPKGKQYLIRAIENGPRHTQHRPDQLFSNPFAGTSASMVDLMRCKRQVSSRTSKGATKMTYCCWEATERERRVASPKAVPPRRPQALCQAPSAFRVHQGRQARRSAARPARQAQTGRE